MAVILDVAVATVLITLTWVSYRKSQGAPLQLPPSPPADFLIGHARKIPFHKAWEVYAKWKETYGDVIYAHALGRSIVVLNSFTAARDLLETKGGSFSDRPGMPVFYIMGWELILPLLRYGPRFRKQRRIVHQYFSPSAIHAYRPIQEYEVSKFLHRLAKDPENFLTHIHTFVAGTIVSIAYGHEVKAATDSYVGLVEKALHMTTHSDGLGITFIDLFPFLRFIPSWVPGMGLKRHALKTRSVVDSVMTIPLEELKAKRAAGSAPTSVVTDLLEKYEDMGTVDPEHEEDIMNIGAMIYNAGTDTTKSMMMIFFLMMALHPEVVKRAQEEIDTVVGRDRLPTADDRKNLPFTNCILKELYRIQPPVPTCVPHMSTEAVQYRGWTIPKGTVAIPNIWKMMNEEKVFPEPHLYKPERFMAKVKAGGNDASAIVTSEEGEGSVVEDDPSTMVFGFGRRVCPGKYAADATLWLAMTSVLAVFDISPYKNPKTGQIEVPKYDIEIKAVVCQKPFKCSVTPREGRWVDGSPIGL